MKVRKLAVFVVLLVLAAALMVACGGQEKSTSNTGSSTTASSNAASSATASGAASTFDGLEEKEVRVATTEEDYQIFDGYPYIELYVSKNTQRQIPMGDKIYVTPDNAVSENGYYEKDDLSNTIKNLYHPISGLPILEGYGHLIGTYGNIPVIELDRQTDTIVARDHSKGNLAIYKCKLVGCTISWVSEENAIWNQNDLISIGNPNNLQLTDANGQSRSNPMAWEFGEEVIAECDGQSYQTHTDSYVYAVDDKKIELSGGDVKIKYGKYTDTLFGYDFSKLEPGLYYFQDLGVYKIV